MNSIHFYVVTKVAAEMKSNFKRAEKLDLKQCVGYFQRHILVNPLKQKFDIEILSQFYIQNLYLLS